MVQRREAILPRLGVLWIAACLGFSAPPWRAAADEPLFAEIESPIGGDRTEDLGVVDFNGDGRLDLFTSNHEFEAALYRARADGVFEDVSRESTFGIDPDLPGLESARIVRPRDGLHIFFKRRDLVVRVLGFRHGGANYSGRVELPRLVKWIKDQGMKATKAGIPWAHRDRGKVIEFSTESDGQLRFLPQLPPDSIYVQIDESVPLETVFVGRHAVPAPSHRIRLFQVDRHGMAWSDFDADGDLDVFVNVGGALGMVPDSVNDELLINHGGRFRDAATAAGIDKRRSRGRRAEWGDYDGDGRLDLYTGNQKTPNRLWIQNEEHRFTDRAVDLGLDLEDGDRFRWLDADRDGDLDLFAAGRGGPARLFRNDGGSFRSEDIADSTTADPRQIVIADVDNDGDTDILVVEPADSRLLVAQGGTFVTADPVELGLPKGSLTAAWVDFDNDGRIDLHTAPDGLFRQGEDGRFALVGLPITAKRMEDARCTWLDLDADGDRDCLCEVITDFYEAVHLAYRNQSAGAHWLALDLVGAAGNRQAIGATAVIETAAGERSAHVVGESDSSHFSQGHYRIYRGLGNGERVASVEITWPDGSVQRLEDVEGDRRIEVRYDEKK